MEEKLILSRCILSKKIYELLRESCDGNTENQEYLLTFVDLFLNHIGYGNFVIELLQAIFKNNDRIVGKLRKLSFKKKGELDKNDSISFLKMLYCKAKEVEPNQRKEILSLISQLCFNGEKFIYLTILINLSEVFINFINSINFINFILFEVFIHISSL